MATGTLALENYVPAVRQNQGIYSKYDIRTTGSLLPTGASSIRVSSASTYLFSGTVSGPVSGTPGTLTPTHKVAVNIEGVGVRYFHVGTTA